MKYLLINLTIWAFIALGASLFAQDAPLEGTRKYRFSWDANPETVVTGYLLEFRVINENGTKGQWATITELVGRETVEVVIGNCPDGPYETTLIALHRDPITTNLLAMSDRSDIVSVPGSPSAPKGLKFEVTTLASDNLVSWVPISVQIVESDKEFQFYKSLITRLE